MNYKGVIIEESLQDFSLLREITILERKIELVTPEHKTPWLKKWTLCTVEISKDNAGKIANKLSKSFNNAHPNWL